MKAAVILFPGSNREQDALNAFEKITGVRSAVVWHGERSLPAGTDLALLPGGFSYGDYLRCGAIAARAPIMDAVRAHAARGGLILGICNGFQILIEAGLLPGVLMRNANMRFVCRMQHLTVERNDTLFTSRYTKGQIIKVAVAHGEGYYIADKDTIARLEGDGRIAFRYCDERGERGGGANPNGSINDIAGIYSERFNVLGLMPHPENLIDPLVGGTDGRGLFESLAGARRLSQCRADGDFLATQSLSMQARRGGGGRSGRSVAPRRRPIAKIALIEDPAKNFVAITKEGTVYKNNLSR